MLLLQELKEYSCLIFLLIIVVDEKALIDDISHILFIFLKEDPVWTEEIEKIEGVIWALEEINLRGGIASKRHKKINSFYIICPFFRTIKND